MEGQGLSRISIRIPRRIHEWYRERGKDGLTMTGHMIVALEQYMMSREALENARDFQALYRELSEGLNRLEKKLDEAISGRREPAEGKP